MNQFYYPRTTKGVTIALMNVFNDMIVQKYDKNGNHVKDISVPIQFGPIEKAQHDRLEGHYFDTDNNEHGSRFYLTIPRMSITLDNIVYNPDRAYGINEYRYWKGHRLDQDEEEIIFKDYQPTPWDLNYSLYIKSDSLDYFSQIIENILPYFNPSVFLRVREFSFLNIERDLKTTLNSISPEFIQDMNNEDTKYCNATLSFTVEAFMYRPWSHANIIEVINSKYFVGDSSTPKTYNSTSGVELNSDGNPYPTSAVPEYDEIYTSGTSSDAVQSYNWYKGKLIIE